MTAGRRRIDWTVASIVLVVAALTYGPVVMADHMIHDDYWLAMFSPAATCRLTPEWTSLVLIGRVLGAELTRCVAFPLLQSLGGPAFFTLSRAVNVLSFALLSALVAHLVITLSGRRAAATAVGLAFLATPIAILFATTGITATSVLALNVTCIAMAIIVWSRRTWWQLVTATALLAIGFAVYQVFPVYVFAVIVLIALFATDDVAPAYVRTVAWLAAAFVIAAAVYFLLQKTVFQPMGERVAAAIHFDAPDSRKFETVTSPVAMVKNLGWFYLSNAKFGGSLWFPYGRTVVAAYCLGITATLAAIASGLSLWRRRRREPGRGNRGFLIRVAMLAVGALGCHMLVLTRADGGSHYRTGSPITLLWISVLLWSVLSLVERLGPARNWGRRAVVAGAFGTCLFAQYFSVNNVLLVATNEYAYLTGAFQPLLEGRTNHLQVQPPDVRSVLFHSDEFGVLTTGVGNGYSARGPFSRALTGAGLSPGQFRMGPYTADGIEVYDLAAAAAGRLDPPLPVTLRPLVAGRRPGLATAQTIVASSTHMTYGPEHLGDRTYHTAWHAAVPVQFPQVIEFAFARPEFISAVQFAAQPGFLDRGPKDVEIQGSKDGAVWSRLGGTADACTKTDGEAASIAFSPAAVTRLRVVVRANCGNAQLLTIQWIELRTQ